MKGSIALSTPPAPPKLDRQAEIHEVLEARWSTRAFSVRPVEPAAIVSLFEAARWAPSSANEQPWQYVAATKEDLPVYNLLLESMSENNRRWASAAPLIILALARTTYSRTGKPNRHSWYDLGQSVASLVFEATTRGLMVHQIGGFDPERILRGYQVPDGVEPVVLLAVGYPGDPESLPEELRQRERLPRSRKPLGSLVFTESWGAPSHHVNVEVNKFSKPSIN